MRDRRPTDRTIFDERTVIQLELWAGHSMDGVSAVSVLLLSTVDAGPTPLAFILR